MNPQPATTSVRIANAVRTPGRGASAPGRAYSSDAAPVRASVTVAVGANVRLEGGRGSGIVESDVGGSEMFARPAPRAAWRNRFSWFTTHSGGATVPPRGRASRTTHGRRASGS